MSALQNHGVYTAVDLCDKTIPPMRWVVKDFLGEGTTLLSARPKAGKSLLAVQIAIAVASGKPFLGTYETVKGAVLYVNVDDPSQRRLQANLHLLGGRVDGLSFMSALPELDNGGLEILDEELARMAKIEPYRLLILDTLTALRKEQSGKNLVKSDYEFIAGIKGLESKHGCSVLLISHSRKDSTSSEKVDGIDAHLGTTGLTAAVDAVMLLTGAEDTRKVLRAKGRDISPFEVHLELQVEDRSGWLVVDAPVEPAKKKELGALQHKILDAVRAIGPCRPDAISKATGVNASTIRVYVPRMAKAGLLAHAADGSYSAEVHTPCVAGVAVVAVAEDPATATGATVQCYRPPTSVAPTEPAEAVEVTANPAPALEAATEPAAQNDIKLMDLPLDQKVYLCVKRGMSSPTDISQKIAELRPVVLHSLSRQTSVGKLREFTEKNGQTGWEVVPGRGGKKPTIPAISQNDGMEASQWLN